MGVNESTYIKEVKTKISQDLAERISLLKTNTTLLCATALDPRFKRLKFLSQPDHDMVYVKIREEVSSITRTVTRNVSPAPNPSRLEPSRTHTLESENEDDLEENAREIEVAEPPTKKASILQDIDSDDSADDEEKDEVAEYMAAKKLSSTEDPLVWWKINQNNFPKLVQLALKYLVLPATSVPSERLFSNAGNLVTKNRSRLSGRNVDNLLFLHSFLNQKEA